ncbi:magnesium-transporting ATPase (P-type) [Enterococcus sp. UD-01]|jgi:hypothetical protein
MKKIITFMLAKHLFSYFTICIFFFYILFTSSQTLSHYYWFFAAYSVLFNVEVGDKKYKKQTFSEQIHNVYWSVVILALVIYLVLFLCFLIYITH